MEMSSTSSKKVNKTFADKFSIIKSRFMILFWLLFFGLLIKFSYPFLNSLYSITKFQDSYFEITIRDSKPTYLRVIVKPKDWVSIDKISKKIQGAVISSEDGKFYDHPGYDLEQLRGAIEDSFVKKKKMRGASTITQQLIKNIYLSKDRTFGRKIKELIMSLMIEKYADKKKILETYLNVIEYGKGLYGIKAATQFYFKKDPSQINAREAAFLAMLLPSPKKYSKSFKNRNLTDFAKRMIESILLKMRQGGYIGEEEYQIGLNGHFSWENPANITSPTVDKSEEESSDFNNEDESDN